MNRQTVVAELMKIRALLEDVNYSLKTGRDPVEVNTRWLDRIIRKTDEVINPRGGWNE